MEYKFEKILLGKSLKMGKEIWAKSHRKAPKNEERKLKKKTLKEILKNEKNSQDFFPKNGKKLRKVSQENTKWETDVRKISQEKFLKNGRQI